MGYVKGRNIIQNAQRHKRKRWVLRVDLSNFFGQINFGRVRGLFLSMGMAEEAATCVAQICCDGDSLPQGAPTSPVVSNMICMKLDRELGKLSRENGLVYSRYVDDLIFSTRKKVFPRSHYDTDTLELGLALRAVIENNGFNINEKKTKLAGNYRRQMVTGLVVNEMEAVPREKVRELRQQIFYANKFGIESVAAKFFREKDRKNRVPGADPDFLQVLKGRLEFIRSVKGPGDSVYCALATQFAILDPTYIVPSAALQHVRIILEGESEAIYFRRAYKAVQRIDPLGFNPDFSHKEGDNRLMTFLKTSERHPPRDFTICIFDHDSDSIVSKARDHAGSWRKWNENLFSTTISKPDFRLGNEHICAEFLFKDEDVLQWKGAHRMFFKNEFGPSGECKDDPSYSLLGKKGYLIPTRVVDQQDRNVLINKVDLALAIERREEPFTDVDYEGFRNTFREIGEIVRYWQSTQ